eukprot:CAMPEP_0177651768 /NCGR_PEP_ID=MMETSP0447-20121125/12736_1 /TAXON_ID=0 /ORGANISM="Stygamoeba regulata, Strain BSH-02190019" /LENGTH=160 /DNA_ID=CAMNT_0019154895 /DNA_START=39 /DNA_END=521 /DNA_ORIENTATION=-
MFRSLARPQGALGAAARAAWRRQYSTNPEAVKLTFAAPHASLFNKEDVRCVTIPARYGVMGVYPGHVPTIAPLKPGVVIVEREGKQEKYFISGGFAYVHPDSSCDISVAEYCALDDIDPAAAKAGLEQYQQKFNSATDPQAKAIAEIGMEVHEAMVHALG